MNRYEEAWQPQLDWHLGLGLGRERGVQGWRIRAQPHLSLRPDEKASGAGASASQ
jgi:hypothetical protein